MHSVSLLGSTGSVGVSTLDVIAQHPARFTVAALGAHRNWRALLDQCLRFKPAVAALLDRPAARELARALASHGAATTVLDGAEGLEAIAAWPSADTVLAAIVGAAGLAPTLAAARAGKRVLLANKEALVIGGAAFMREVRAGGATLLPIDSEHNAVFQCLPAAPVEARDARSHPHAPPRGVRRILLTASGGPFRTRDPASLGSVTPAEACAHPTWRMGRKISVDSATMMNKGLEVIEAHHLFGVPRSMIEVVIHPQSVIHSMVEYADGSILAQMGHPDMRTPIAQALAHPERIDAGVPGVDFATLGSLTFEAPDLARFPCLRLAYAALEAGGTAPAVLNGANEVAVAAFLDGLIAYPDIARACAGALERVPAGPLSGIDDALEADARSRSAARAILRLSEPHAPAALTA